MGDFGCPISRLDFWSWEWQRGREGNIDQDEWMNNECMWGGWKQNRESPKVRDRITANTEKQKRGG